MLIIRSEGDGKMQEAQKEMVDRNQIRMLLVLRHWWLRVRSKREVCRETMERVRQEKRTVRIRIQTLIRMHRWILARGNR